MTQEDEMRINAVAVGQLETNCYIVSDDNTNDAIIIDPGDEPDRVLELAEGLNITHIVLTHAHFDHAGAVAEIKEATGAEIALHAEEAGAYSTVTEQAAFWGFDQGPLPEPDILLDDGDEIRFGSSVLKVLHTPGHGRGCICLLGEGLAFTGDTVFRGSVVMTDFPGGDMAELRASFRKLMGLPPETRLYPGHGPATTVAEERTGNILSSEL